jgi:hypothetical protein
MYKLLRLAIGSFMGTLFLFSSSAWAINLNQIPNTDRREFQTNPGTDMLKPDRWYFLGEYNLSANALVLRNKTSGAVTPLVKNLMGLDLGLSYGFNDWAQIGVVAPLLMSQGNQSAFLLTGPTMEIKFKILDELVLVPSYQFPLTSNLQVSDAASGFSDNIKMGAPGGTYGAKVVYQKGHVYEGYGIAGQLGYYSSPGNSHTAQPIPGTFYTIDQSSTMVMGLSGGMPLSQSVNAVAEVYGEKSGDNFPVELLGLINVRGESVNWQIGGGTGNIQGSGSNTYKAFIGLTYTFGGGGSGGYSSVRPTRDLVMPQVSKPKKNSDNHEKPANRLQDDNRPIMEDGIDESVAPDALEPAAPSAPAIPDVPGAGDNNE